MINAQKNGTQNLNVFLIAGISALACLAVGYLILSGSAGFLWGWVILLAATQFLAVILSYYLLNYVSQNQDTLFQIYYLWHLHSMRS